MSDWRDYVIILHDNENIYQFRVCAQDEEAVKRTASVHATMVREMLRRQQEQHD